MDGHNRPFSGVVDAIFEYGPARVAPVGAAAMLNRALGFSEEFNSDDLREDAPPQATISTHQSAEVATPPTDVTAQADPSGFPSGRQQ